MYIYERRVKSVSKIFSSFQLRDHAQPRNLYIYVYHNIMRAKWRSTFLFRNPPPFPTTSNHWKYRLSKIKDVQILCRPVEEKARYLSKYSIDSVDIIAVLHDVLECGPTHSLACRNYNKPALVLVANIIQYIEFQFSLKPIYISSRGTEVIRDTNYESPKIDIYRSALSTTLTWV